MIEGLANLLAGREQTGLSELTAVLRTLLGQHGRHWNLTAQVPLQVNKCRVFRLRFDWDGHCQSVIVKSLKPGTAQRIEAALGRWLPAANLQESSPELLGVAAELGGKCVWHVYQDLGPWALDGRSPSPERTNAAVDLIAKLHTRFAGHPLLGEARLEGTDFSFNSYSATLRDAAAGLESLRIPGAQLSSDRAALCERLLDRLGDLLAQQSWRRQFLAEHGGPETLLHGDLWRSNIFVRPSAGSFRAWLIDWDRIGVGPVSYDLSTLLLRFPSQARRGILERYRTAVSALGWQLPSDDDLNQLFETAELARFTNMILWPAIALMRNPLGWGWERLADIEQWFEQMEPVLPPQQNAQVPQLVL